MMAPKVLLVNPPIYDFSAYDFWLKPYGLLCVAGFLRGQADMHLFDYLDRWQDADAGQRRGDAWDRGPFASEVVAKPPIFADIPRYYRRYGLPRSSFQARLAAAAPYDVALIQTVMTYWYPGVKEVIEDIRALSPQTRIVLGGVYATLCPHHARGLGADLVIEHTHLEPLWRLLRLTPNLDQPPLWEAYPRLVVGIMKLADGCPFRCTYCSVPWTTPVFTSRPLLRSQAEFDLLQQRGVRNVAFYDDALLFKPAHTLLPFLEYLEQQGSGVHLHTPNALNARFVTREIATSMIRAGFKTFYLGFESRAYAWQRRTGGKVYAAELVRAVDHFVDAGADLCDITAYLIVGHPQADLQDVKASMQFAHALGLRLMLAEFSPIPGTPDGEHCRQWVDLHEPLWHNKTVFPLRLLGFDEVQRLKTMCRALNQRLRSARPVSAITSDASVTSNTRIGDS
jgi:hypothetical protein